jgi:hypothetical protein
VSGLGEPRPQLEPKRPSLRARSRRAGS